mmetsp:Transcript_1844/g.6790  ORF Transcript_1844/g.6790 Transcript_1844/m.6790 type:complete len:213 (-) Transcript_1844:66-704(-)
MALSVGSRAERSIGNAQIVVVHIKVPELLTLPNQIFVRTVHPLVRLLERLLRALRRDFVSRDCRLRQQLLELEHFEDRLERRRLHLVRTRRAALVGTQNQVAHRLLCCSTTRLHLLAEDDEALRLIKGCPEVVAARLERERIPAEGGLQEGARLLASVPHVFENPLEHQSASRAVDVLELSLSLTTTAFPWCPCRRRRRCCRTNSPASPAAV